MLTWHPWPLAAITPLCRHMEQRCLALDWQMLGRLQEHKHQARWLRLHDGHYGAGCARRVHAWLRPFNLFYLCSSPFRGEWGEGKEAWECSLDRPWRGPRCPLTTSRDSLVRAGAVALAGQDSEQAGVSVRLHMW